MTDLTPRNSFPYPSEREQPFWDSFKANVLAEDAAIYANADNGNLTFYGGGIFSWNAGSDLLFWTEEILVSGFSTPFSVTLPPGSVEIQENEVVFFQMPRLLQQNAQVQLWRSSQIYAEGIRLHDLRLFVTRRNDTLYFMNGLSLEDGDTGVLFGAGLIKSTTVIPHNHEDPFVFTDGVGGTLSFIPLPIITQPTLSKLDVYKNGLLQVDGVDYAADYSTGVVTLSPPGVATVPLDRFVVHRETIDTTVTVSSHQHIVPLIPAPAVGSTFPMMMSAPYLLRVDVFRNGQLLAPGATADYTVDLALGQVTLAVAAVITDTFVFHRYAGIP